MAVNCGALPDGLLEAEFFGHARGAFTGAESARPGLVEAANGGTLFLDEVGELSPHGQATLLRVLQEREFRRVGETRTRRSDFRLIAATHRPLAELAGAGEFRRDLFYRLRVVRLPLPPLRERRSEIPELAATLLTRPRPPASSRARPAVGGRPRGARPPRLAGQCPRTGIGARGGTDAAAGNAGDRPRDGGRESPGTSGPAAAAPDPLHAVMEIRRLALARAASNGSSCCGRCAAPPGAGSAPPASSASPARASGRN